MKTHYIFNIFSLVSYYTENVLTISTGCAVSRLHIILKKYHKDNLFFLCFCGSSRPKFCRHQGTTNLEVTWGASDKSLEKKTKQRETRLMMKQCRSGKSIFPWPGDYLIYCYIIWPPYERDIVGTAFWADTHVKICKQIVFVLTQNFLSEKFIDIISRAGYHSVFAVTSI